jgi:hypothetical protein
MSNTRDSGFLSLSAVPYSYSTRRGRFRAREETPKVESQEARFGQLNDFAEELERRANLNFADAVKRDHNVIGVRCYGGQGWIWNVSRRG